MDEDKLPRRRQDSEKMAENEEDDKIGLEREIRIDEDRPGFSTKEEMQQLRRDSEIQRLSHRMTLLSILIPFVICAALVGAYLDVTDKLGKIKLSGYQDMQTLSEETIGKLASLSEEFNASAGRLSVLEKTVLSIKETMDHAGHTNASLRVHGGNRARRKRHPHCDRRNA